MPTEPLKPFSLTHHTRTFETGITGKITASALINILQHAAGKHADELGWSVRSLHESGQTWVLQRFFLSVNKLPKDDEIFTVTTRPSGADRLLAYRDYKVTGQDGAILATASSSWVVMSLETRRPVSISDHVKELGSAFGPRILEAPNNRLRPFEPTSDEMMFHVRKHDLDLNSHVNNVRYIEWALEALPDKYFETKPLKNVDITFKAECFYGDKIISAIQNPSAGIFNHCLIRTSDSKPVCLMQTVF